MMRSWNNTFYLKLSAANYNYHWLMDIYETNKIMVRGTGKDIYLECHHIEQRDFATRCRHNIWVIFGQCNAGGCFFWVAIVRVICHQNPVCWLPQMRCNRCSRLTGHKNNKLRKQAHKMEIKIEERKILWSNLAARISVTPLPFPQFMNSIGAKSQECNPIICIQQTDNLWNKEENITSIRNFHNLQHQSTQF